jgi:hypothetical protein
MACLLAPRAAGFYTPVAPGRQRLLAPPPSFRIDPFRQPAYHH